MPKDKLGNTINWYGKFNSNKPDVSDEKEIDFKFAPDTDQELYKEDVIVQQDPHLGARIDLLLKLMFQHLLKILNLQQCY